MGEGLPRGKARFPSTTAFPCRDSASHSSQGRSLPPRPLLIPLPLLLAALLQARNRTSHLTISVVFKFNGPSSFFPPQHLGWVLCSSPGKRQLNNAGRVECCGGEGLVCGRTDSHLAPWGRGFRRDGPGAQGLLPSHCVCRALQECPRSPTSISTQPPEGETRLQRLAGLRGRDRKKGKACLSQWTAHGFGLGSREREEGQSVCGRQKVGEPSQGGGMQVEVEGWVLQQLGGSRCKTGRPAWGCVRCPWCCHSLDPRWPCRTCPPCLLLPPQPTTPLKTKRPFNFVALAPFQPFFSFLHSFIQQVFTEHLLCAVSTGHSSEQNRLSPYPP